VTLLMLALMIVNSRTATQRADYMMGSFTAGAQQLCYCVQEEQNVV